MMSTPVTPAADALWDVTTRAVETFSLWADVNQKILRTLVDCSASTAREGVRVYAEMQSSAVEALKEGQTYVLERRQDLVDAAGDPVAVYQRGVLGSVERAQWGMKLLEGTAEAMTRSAERLRVTAEHAGQEIQAAVTDLVGTRLSGK